MVDKIGIKACKEAMDLDYYDKFKSIHVNAKLKLYSEDKKIERKDSLQASNIRV